MELTNDYFLYLLGILMGVGLTILGIIFTEHLKNNKDKKRLTVAFRNEVLTNLQKANFNLDLMKIGKKKSRQAFYTTAYEQLRHAILLDWTKSKLCSNILDGFTFAEEYNKRISHPERFEEEMGSEKVILEEIRGKMFDIDKTLQNCKNIESALKYEELSK